MTLRRLEYFKTLIDMELTLKRETFTDESTIGSLYIDDVFECFILEDKDRGLTDRIMACNGLIRSNWATFCDAIADAGALAQFDQKKDVSNSTYYFSDRTHLQNAGYDLVSGLIETAIRSIA